MVLPVLGILIIVGFLLMEARLRRGEEAKSWAAGRFDQRSTLYILIAYLVCGVTLLAAGLFDRWQIALLPMWAGWFGIAIALLGFRLRVWSMRVLGQFYTRTLRVTANQSIVRDGPYRSIRHPGYLSSILIWSGVALSTTNWIVLLVVFAVLLGVYAYRIEAEENMLAGSHPEYAEYRKETWRLIPLVY